MTRKKKKVPTDLLKYGIEKRIKEFYDDHYAGNMCMKTLHLYVFEENYKKEDFENLPPGELRKKIIEFLEDVQALVLQMGSGYCM